MIFDNLTLMAISATLGIVVLLVTSANRSKRD
jgi:hypothetical protein